MASRGLDATAHTLSLLTTPPVEARPPAFPPSICVFLVDHHACFIHAPPPLTCPFLSPIAPSQPHMFSETSFLTTQRQLIRLRLKRAESLAAAGCDPVPARYRQDRMAPVRATMEIHTFSGKRQYSSLPFAGNTRPNRSRSAGSGRNFQRCEGLHAVKLPVFSHQKLRIANFV